MPTTVDDLDDLLRAAMKSLDDQVPSGYLDALPEQTLARLEATMQSSGQGTSERERDAMTAPPAAVAPKTVPNEDSGLHDIRNLAQSTKQRLSSRRISSSSLRPSDDDILAASSAGWKAVALPEPAKMVSLPSIDELPSKAEIRAQEKAAAKAAAVEAPAGSASAPIARPAAPAKSRRVLAFVSAGLAAAAGFAIFVATRPGEKSEAPTMAVAHESQAAGQPMERARITATPIPAPAPAPTPPAAVQQAEQQDLPRSDTATSAVTGAVPAAKPAVMHSPSRPKKAGGGAAKIDTTVVADKAPDATKKPPAAKDGKDKEATKQQDPSFDQLLKEAGADTKPKVEKPRLANKDLSPDDFKHVMSAVEGNAKGCYKGTQGIAKLTIKVAPSGQVSSVSVGGQFAGKPEAACVTSAVRSASFPPWDGTPQSFSYPILLSE